jgi:nucleotide-binding universal stress UspA family protein
MQISKILVPLDGARAGSKAIEYAVEIARRFSAEVVLARVVPPARIPAAGLAGPESPVVAEMLVEQVQEQEDVESGRVRRYLADRRRSVEAAGVKATTHQEVGDPAQALLAVIRKQRVDLVVMTTRGHSGLKRAFLGSVADEIVRAALCPVLVIRRP